MPSWPTSSWTNPFIIVVFIYVFPTWIDPAKPRASLEHLDPTDPLGTVEITGTYSERVGIRIPRCQPDTVCLIDLVRV